MDVAASHSFATLAHNGFSVLLEYKDKAVRNSVVKQETGYETYLPFLFTDPQLMEGPKTGQDTATQPPTEPSLSRVPRSVYFRLLFKR